MSNYDTMQVCRKRGHRITSQFDSCPQFRREFCSTCGSKTIYKCEECGVKIKGEYYVEGILDFTKTPVPFNCHSCGGDYPWRNYLLIQYYFHKIVLPVKYIFDSIIGIFKK